MKVVCDRCGRALLFDLAGDALVLYRERCCRARVRVDELPPAGRVIFRTAKADVVKKVAA